MKLFLRKHNDRWFESLGFIGYESVGPFFAQDKRCAVVRDIKSADSVGVFSDISTVSNQLIELAKYPNIKYVFLLEVYHMWEEMHQGAGDSTWHVCVLEEGLKKRGVRLIHLHTNPLYKGGVYLDYMWNRQKAVYVNFNKYGYGDRDGEGDTHIGGVTDRMFRLAEIGVKSFKDTKVFLAPNRTNWRYLDYNDRIQKRIALRYFLEDYSGYISDPDRGVALEPQCPEDVVGVPQAGFEGFSPVHVRYYESSYVSIVIETLTYYADKTPVGGITEKSFTPLIQGHFLLPYGYPGMIEHIRKYGFTLPDWIDYSYDTIINDRERFHRYLQSVFGLLSKPLQELEALYKKDKWMLKFNREIFFNRPFDNLYEKVGIHNVFSYI